MGKSCLISCVTTELCSSARSTKPLDVYQLVGAGMFPQIILKVQFCCRVYSKDFF